MARLCPSQMRLARSLVFVAVLVLGLTFPFATANATQDSLGLNIRVSRNADIVRTYLAGSYSHFNNSGIDQIVVQSPNTSGGAVAVSWSLGIDISNIHTVKLSFDMLTDTLTNGTYGARIGASVGLATSPAGCCSSDRGASFPKDSKVVTVSTDCCFAGANLFFDSNLWVNPDPSNSADRTTHVFGKKFPGYSNDGSFHTFSIEMDLDSEATTWSADGGTAEASYPGFTLAPSYLVFWTQGHDTGDYVQTQVRNLQLKVSARELATSSPTSQQPYSQWWFWTIIGLSGVSAGLLYMNVSSRSRVKTGKAAFPHSKGMVCRKCGEEMPSGSTFCGKCGGELNGAA